MTKPAGTWAPACPVFPHPQSYRHPSAHCVLLCGAQLSLAIGGFDFAAP